jgi:nucleotide-binding universal stress UspA family protein
MMKNILFPVDFSTSCIAMAAYVKRAGEIFSAEVSLVHVCDLNSHNGFELYARASDEIAEDHWDVAKTRLEFFLKSVFPPARCRRILLTGDPGAGIAEAARASKCDLIMMPTHAGRFRRMLLGSTTARVLEHADCPVLTTQHAATAAPRSLEHRKWICGIKLGSDSERVLRYATEASLEAGAKLTVMHAVQTDKTASGFEKAEKQKSARNHIAELKRKVASEASVQVAVGPVKESLVAAAEELSADVLVIGRSLRDGSLGRMPELTYALTRDSPCPVVSV